MAVGMSWCVSGRLSDYLRESAALIDSVPDMTAKPPKLLARVRAVMRGRHMSPRTEQSYLAWIRRYARYHSLRHPDSMGDAEVVDFLTYLASEQKVARSTQIQAMSALMLLL
jgi:hypothetical protein